DPGSPGFSMYGFSPRGAIHEQKLLQRNPSPHGLACQGEQTLVDALRRGNRPRLSPWLHPAYALPASDSNRPGLLSTPALFAAYSRTLHNLIVLSLLPDANVRPSGENARQRIMSV